MMMNSCAFGMPGRIAPAFLLAFGGWAGFATPSIAQQPAASIQVPPAAAPVPDQLEMAKLIWSTLLAVDHANKSGNYTVLRDMSAQGFQINNDPARLAQIFAGLRESRIDLSNALVIAPVFYEAPRQIQANVFEVKGVFQLRPQAIQFDLYFQWEQGRWKLFGINIQPVNLSQGTPPPMTPPPAQQAPAPRRR
jgi:hypothetical protein